MASKKRSAKKRRTHRAPKKLQPAPAAPEIAQAAKPQAAAPDTYTPELADAICARMVEKKSLSKVCTCDDMPSLRTVFRWLRDHEEFAKNYAIAFSERADVYFEEMFEIADDGSNDFMEEKGADGKPIGIYKFRKEHVQRSRLRIETRKWALARMNPKKYGDKMTAELTGAGGGPLIVELVKFAGEREQGPSGEGKAPE